MPADAVANGVDDEPEPRADGEPESRPDANADVVADISTDHRGADSGDGAAHIDDAAHGRAGSATYFAAANGAADYDGAGSDDEPEPRADGEPESRPDANADVVADISTDHRGADSGDTAAHIDEEAHGRAGSATDSASTDGHFVVHYDYHAPNFRLLHLHQQGRAQGRDGRVGEQRERRAGGVRPHQHVEHDVDHGHVESLQLLLCHVLQR